MKKSFIYSFISVALAGILVLSCFCGCKRKAAVQQSGENPGYTAGTAGETGLSPDPENAESSADDTLLGVSGQSDSAADVPGAADEKPYEASAVNRTDSQDEIGAGYTPSPLVRAETPDPSYSELSELRDKATKGDDMTNPFYRLNGFSYDMACGLFGENRNTVFSPFSAYMALAVTAAGAKGKTLDEMLSVLRSENIDELNDACAYYFNSLCRDTESCKLLLANSVWFDERVGESKLTLNPDFAETAAKKYSAELFACDFSSFETAAAVSKRINEKTNGLINANIQPNENQAACLINAMYFKSGWSSAFNKSSTVSSHFRTESSGDVTCDMMRTTREDLYYRGNGFTKSSLSLSDGSVTFILPDEGVSVGELFSSPERLREVCEGGEGSECKVHWSVPKFTAQSELLLSQTVQNMGIENAFEPTADFTGMITADDGMPVYIGRVIQDNKFIMDEEGVEGASVTRVEMTCGCAPPEAEPENVYMTLDRPFIYIVKSAGAILFAGVCSNLAA